LAPLPAGASPSGKALDFDSSIRRFDPFRPSQPFIIRPFAEESAMTALAPIVLLFCSNIFMTFAWYGQLKFPNAVLWQVVLISWGIAFFEYCLAVPANRIGYQVYSAAQLKILQEIITLLVFGVFSVTYLGESLRWNNMAAFGFLCCAAFFSFHKWT
jgi:uncharacterized protein